MLLRPEDHQGHAKWCVGGLGLLRIRPRASPMQGLCSNTWIYHWPLFLHFLSLFWDRTVMMLRGFSWFGAQLSFLALLRESCEDPKWTSCRPSKWAISYWAISMALWFSHFKRDFCVFSQHLWWCCHDMGWFLSCASLSTVWKKCTQSCRSYKARVM